MLTHHINTANWNYNAAISVEGQGKKRSTKKKGAIVTEVRKSPNLSSQRQEHLLTRQNSRSPRDKTRSRSKLSFDTKNKNDPMTVSQVIAIFQLSGV
jgi:hypothetical protein